MLVWLIINLPEAYLRNVALNMKVLLRPISRSMGAGERMFYILHSAMIEGVKPLLELSEKLLRKKRGFKTGNGRFY